MTASLQVELTGFRFAEVRFGDTLQSLAARELGDATRWPELASINDLVPPYLVGSLAQAGRGLVAAGSLIRVPAPEQAGTFETDPDLVFGRDVLLQRGQLRVEAGDLQLVSGRSNLRQALQHRLETDRGDLLFHAEYGSLVRRLIGAASGPTASLLAAEYGRAAVEGDDRIDAVLSADAQVTGDLISVSISAQPIVGRQVDVGFSA